MTNEKIIWIKTFPGEQEVIYKGFRGLIQTTKERDIWTTNRITFTETFHRLRIFQESKIIFDRTYSKNLREVKKSFLEEIEKLNNKGDL